MNQTDGAKRTPLHMACAYGEAECAKTLIEWGADMGARDVDGRSPLFFATVNDQFNSVATLLDMGYDGLDDGDNRGDRALHAAVSKGNQNCLSLLLESGADPNVVNSQGHSPCHLAASRELLEALFVAGANMSAQDGAGRTPLFCACATNRLECLLYLLDIDDQAIDTPDVRGDSPMHAACCNGFVNCVEILLQSAADVSLRNLQGYTASHLAELNGHGNVVEIVKLYSMNYKPVDHPDEVAFREKLAKEAAAAAKAKHGLGALARMASVAKLVKKVASRWKTYVDEHSGYVYYYNEETGESQWDKPSEAEAGAGSDAAATGGAAAGAAAGAEAGAVATGDANGNDGSQAGGDGDGNGGGDSDEDAKSSAESPARELQVVTRPQDRKLNKDYSHMATEYVRQEKYRVFSRKKAIICRDKSQPLADVFVPCEHVCACRKCIVEHNIGPLDGANKKMSTNPGAGGDKAVWGACPVCMAKIEAVIPKEKAGKVERAYGPAAKLPTGFKLKRIIPPRAGISLSAFLASTGGRQKVHVAPT